MKKLFIIILIISSCNNIEKKAETECFLNHIGTYKFDMQKTINESGSLGSYSNDSIRLSNFRVTFNKDSTFHMNMKVAFFSDSIGTWRSGNCGFENSGEMSYYTTKAIEQFGPCHRSDSFFVRLAPYDKRYGSITLWFKRY